MSLRAAGHDGELLGVQLATLFVTAENGRMLCDNAPDRSAGPRLYLSGCRSGNVLRLRHDVGEHTARALETLAADEPPLDRPDSTPVHLDAYLRLLAAEAPIEHRAAGLNWSFPKELAYEHHVTLIRSATDAGDDLLARLAERGMPAALATMGFVDVGELWAPWCVALDGDDIASIAFASRLGPAAAETGVATVPACRGRGFAAAATAGWASHPALQGRRLFYGTDRTNRSSQRVVERLGLRFLGASLAIT